MKELKHLMLSMTIQILIITVLGQLNQIAYKESIYAIFWIGLLYNVLSFFVGYYIAKRLLRHKK